MYQYWCMYVLCKIGKDVYMYVVDWEKLLQYTRSMKNTYFFWFINYNTLCADFRKPGCSLPCAGGTGVHWSYRFPDELHRTTNYHPHSYPDWTLPLSSHQQGI